MSKSSASYQPLPQTAMDPWSSRGKEEPAGACGCGQHEQTVDSTDGGCRARHGVCHEQRKRRLARMLAIIALFSLVALVVVAFASGGLNNLMNCAGSALGKRQSSSSSNDFTDHKRAFSPLCFGAMKLMNIFQLLVYLIVIFVGLFLCLVFGIMLAAWCCRGSFENPLCCPCYLCACCGGLGA